MKVELDKLVMERKSSQTNFVVDNRNQTEKQSINRFVRAWNKVNPRVAPFLGNWSSDWTINIYPSKHKDKVCYVSIDEGHMNIEVGKAIGNYIQLEGGRIIIKSNEYLGLVNINQKGRAEISVQIPLHAPKPLKNIGDFDVNDSKELLQSYQTFK